MEKTPTLLMKELKFLKKEAERLYNAEEERSYAPVNEKMSFKYDTNYSYEDTRKELKKIHDEELRIRSALVKFNCTTKVIGYDLTISEALIKIAQLRNEVDSLEELAEKSEYFEDDDDFDDKRPATMKVCYDIKKAKADLRKCEKELTDLQIAVDKTNLTVPIDC